MKFFLDSAKIDEIREAYDTFGIDGITTNPNHIMNSGKPFYTVLQELADFVKEKGLENLSEHWILFPISVEINPHLDDVDEMVEMGILGKPDESRDLYRLRRNSFVDIIGETFDTVETDIVNNNEEV